MNAVLSGRAGIAIVRNDSRCFRFDYDAESWTECPAEEDVWHTFGECRDFEFLEQTDRPSVAARLKDAVRESDALDLVLTLLDAFEYADDTLMTAAEELEDRLIPAVRVAIEKVLFACPLPKGINEKRAFSFAQSHPRVKAFLASLLDLQPSIRAVHDGWLSVPFEMFPEPAYREVFCQHLMRDGLYRDSVIAHHAAKDVGLTIMAGAAIGQTKKLKNYNTVLMRWAASFGFADSVTPSDFDRTLLALEKQGLGTIAAFEARFALERGDTALARIKFSEAGRVLENHIFRVRKQREKHLFRFLAATQYYKGGCYATAFALFQKTQSKLLPAKFRPDFLRLFHDVKDRASPGYSKSVGWKMWNFLQEKRPSKLLELLREHPYVLNPGQLVVVRAIAYEELKDYRTASAFFGEAFRREPNDIELVLLTGVCPLTLPTEGETRRGLGVHQLPAASNSSSRDIPHRLDSLLSSSVEDERGRQAVVVQQAKCFF